MPEVLNAINLEKSYRKSSVYIPALDGVSLQVEQGEFLVIVGKSGSGKTTLLQLLGGLARPTSGELRYRGDKINTYSSSRLALYRRREIGFVFQEYNLLPTLTAVENVMLPLRYLGIKKSERFKQANSMLKQVGLDHRKDHFPSELSGGEQQRVAVARALVHEPGIILGDEITGSIDSASAQELIQYLLELHSDREQTIVMVTHDPMLEQVASRVLHLADGKLVH